MEKFILKPPAWPRLTVQTSSETTLNVPALEEGSGEERCVGRTGQLWAQTARVLARVLCSLLHDIQLRSQICS